jgi:hypothetical protein
MMESKLKKYPTTPEKQVCILLYCNLCLWLLFFFFF